MREKDKNRLYKEKRAWDKRGSLGLGPVEIAGYYECGKPLDEETIDIMAAQIVADLDVKESDSFLEVGCGNGLFLSRMTKHTGNIAGVDFSSQMLKHAKELCESARLLCAEAGSLPFEDDSFDKVLCNGVFHHFPDYEYAERALRELLRVCRKGGRVLIAGLPGPEEEELQNSLILRKERNLLVNMKILVKWYIAEKLGRRSRFIFYPRDFFPSRLEGYDIQVETEAGIANRAFSRYKVLISNIEAN